jgi:type VI secretion system secreted protein VgrG
MSILVLTTSSEALAITHFRAVEKVSTPFAIELWADSADASLDLSAIVGHPATFRADAGHVHALHRGARSWSGLITHGEQLRAVPVGLGQAGTSAYRFSLSPDVWRLSQRRNHRIFQHLSLPDIVEKVLHEWSIRHAWDIDRAQYPKLEFKVQYAESDEAFVARLLEEAGIAFTFTTDSAGHSVLALSDSLERSAPRAPLPYVDNPNEASEQEFVTRVALAREVRPGSLAVRDYDPRHPALTLLAQATPVASEARYEQMHHDAGAFLVERGKPAGTPVADDKGFARHDLAYGKALAERMLQGERLGSHAIELDSNAYDLAPGSVFAMDEHPHDNLDDKRAVLVIETTFEGRSQGEWSLSLVAVPADMPYRTPRRTPKPRVLGVQSATVVGPAGQEIHVDELGRVRIELHWDRAEHHDERSSCWVRVSQGWGGAGYGTVALPRIGQEVFLAFLEGDPDHPVITGRAYNAMEQVPYKLPLHRTRSTWKSDSSPGSGGFNEIMIEDLADKELVFQQAQKDRTRLVKNDELATVVHDRRKLVKKDESEHTDGERQRWIGKDADGVVKHDRRERIEGDSHLEVGGDLRELVGGDQSLTVVGDQQEQVKGRLALRAGKQVHAVAEEIVGEAADDVTIAGPGGFLRIDASGITIEGTVVKINVSGSPGKGRGSKPEAPEEA